MTPLLAGNPEVQAAYTEFQRYCADPDMRELERQRRQVFENQRISIGTAREVGKLERVIEIAQIMKRAGADIAFIAQMTGLTRSEIKRLNQLKSKISQRPSFVENDTLDLVAYEEFLRTSSDDEIREFERRRRRFREDQLIYTGAARDEGKTEADAEIVRNMKNKGFDNAMIAELTGLSLAEIERLN